MFNLLPVAKLAAQLVAGLGVSKVVGDVLKSSTTVATRMDAIRVKVGIGVISGIIAEQGTKSIDRNLDKVAAWYVGRQSETEDEPTPEDES